MPIEETGGPAAEEGPGPGFSRRRFLGWVVAAPVLVTAARVEPALAATGAPGRQAYPARTAGAVGAAGPVRMQPIPSPDQPADIADLGDYLILAAEPTNFMIHVTVRHDGRIGFVMPREENGQGLRTGVAMIIADELDVPLSYVDVTLADADPALVFNQITGGSSGIRTLWDPVRAACAIARGELLAAAADELGVPISSLTAADGVVHAPDGRSLTYGKLSGLAAATTTRPAAATPKSPSQYKIIGTPVAQLANRDIVTGREAYTTDLSVPGAEPTMVRRPPTIMGRLKSFRNRERILAMPGILDVAALPFGVAVRGRTFGQVIDAVNAVEATWNPGPTAGMDDTTINARLAAAASALPGAELPVPVPGARVLEADFEWAFVNHSPMEPNVAIADVRADRAEIWSPLQNPIVTLQQIALDLGLPQSAVTVHVIRGGGSFGRTLWFDAAVEAARISKAMGKPIKLMWHRTNDMRVGRAHPQAYHKLQAVISGGSVLSYTHRVACVQADINPGLGEIITYTTAKPDLGQEQYDQFLFQTTVACPYNFGAVNETLTELPLQFWTSSWRSVYSYDTRGSEEMVVDEIA
ncbi:MAG: molybdopterin cofactor-binding domain-containing protein, partial [Acidimicrobiales bacterium]